MQEGHLRRVLTLWDLIVYGIVLIMPIAAVPLYGLVEQESGGHAVPALLIGMVAMTLTAYSYGKMASKYPAAGSAYTFVSQGLNPHAGFIAGWAMLVDYLLVPIACVLYAALAIERVAPGLPHWAWCLLLVTGITGVNLIGVRSTASANLALMIAALVVIVPFMGLAIHWLLVRQGWHGVLSSAPLYHPATFHWKSLAGATALAALTYGGFDGVSTLSEEVENPRRNIMLATIIVCVFTGLFSSLQVYLAQRVQGDVTHLRNAETAFMDVARMVGGKYLFAGLGAILIASCLGSGLTAQAGVSRLLFGMGRAGALPRAFFGHLSARFSVPTWNLLLTGVVAFLGSLWLSYERVAELINFGAFLAFMGVNAAAIHTFYLQGAKDQRRVLADLLLPLGGLLFCFGIWCNLSPGAKVMGFTWLSAGIVYDIVLTRFLHRAPVPFAQEIG